MTAAVVALGTLRHRVAIERPADAPDGSGGVTRGFEPLTVAFARVEPLSAEETMRGYALGLARLHRVTIRARGDVSGGCRVLWRGRTFDVLSVRERDDHGRFEELLCEEIRS
ncbi:phage head closure protein [Methylopila henanensis]|uniref:Phage head closure protein n=1 Tax=Methylopila henanensis TaxID=873516 RepID=A0ABW4K4N6_9HYPH